MRSTAVTLLLILCVAGCRGPEVLAPPGQSVLSADARRAAILRLARCGDPDAAPAIALYLDHASEPVAIVRATAAVGLRMIGDKRAVSALVNAGTDPEPLVRADVMRALGDMGGPAEVPTLARVLGADLDARVRMEAVRALGRIGGEGVIAHLIEGLDDPDASVAFAAHAALIRITDQDLPPARGAWESWLGSQEAAGGGK